MQEDSFYKFCISGCLFLIFVNISITFVGLLAVFPATVPLGNTDNTSNMTEEFLPSGVLDFISGNMFGFLMEGGLILVGLAAIVATRNWNAVAAYLVGAFFWTSYQSSIMVLSYGGFFDTLAMQVFVGMISIGMLVMFLGAMIGMIGGKE
jgi:hypothetical protein